MLRSALTTILQFSLCASSIAEVVTNLDPRLTRDFALIERFAADPSEANAQQLKRAGLPLDIDPQLKVFLYVDGKDADPSAGLRNRSDLEVYLQSWVPPVGGHPYGYYLVRAHKSAIGQLLAKGVVVYAASAYRRLKPLNDLTAIETGALAAQQADPALTGRGVRLAVIDSGFQLDFPDLPDPAAAMDYADYPDTSEDVTDLVSAHGTHVAGTVYGSGELSGGRWRGMAPAAEAIYLKIGDDSTAYASSAAVVGAVRGAATWCRADIMTMSYGGYDYFNDGSSPEEQAVDWGVGQGTTVFMSAGNQARGWIHYSDVLEGGATTDPIAVISVYAGEGRSWGFVLSWYDGPDTSVHLPFTAAVRNSRGDEEPFEAMPQVASLRGTEAREYLARNDLPNEVANFTIQVTNHSESALRFHILTLDEEGGVRFRAADPDFTVLLPSTADSCLSVAAYTSRTRWTAFYGAEQGNGGILGDIAYFSSRGPRIDGHLKPDIAAPGMTTISCRNQDLLPPGIFYDDLIISNDGESGEPADYLALMGTSMSSPAAAGTAGLLLEAEPDLTPAELRRRLILGTRRDGWTGRVPNTTWGWGKIDIVRALAAPKDSDSPVHPTSFDLGGVWPNPFNAGFVVRYSIGVPGLVRLRLIDTSSRTVWRTYRYVARSGWQIEAVMVPYLPSGSYFLEASAGQVIRSVRVTALK